MFMCYIFASLLSAIFPSGNKQARGIMAEKFCLKWNDFQTNVSNTFRKLRTSEHFYDVTLVSDDQQQVQAHKVVLSSSSEYFKNILTSNKHSHPMLCLSGVNKEDLKNILDFIYNGEIQICQDNLDQFLNIAQRFQLEGLIQDKHFEPVLVCCGFFLTVR